MLARAMSDARVQRSAHACALHTFEEERFSAHSLVSSLVRVDFLPESRFSAALGANSINSLAMPEVDTRALLAVFG